MKLEKLELTRYLKKLEANGIEVLVDIEASTQTLETKGYLNIYVGLETSGSLHVGHILPLLVVKHFAKYDNCRTYILFSEFHCRANKKLVDYSAYKTIKKLSSFKSTECILSSNLSDVASSSSKDNFMFSSEYTKLVYRLMTLSKVKKLVKSTSMANREEYEAMPISQLLYGLYQSADIIYLDIDLAIAGSDQRKIHMFHNDEHSNIKKCNYIHLPILKTSRGQKISKSLFNNILPIDENIVTNFYNLEPVYKQYLQTLFEVLTDNVYSINTILTQLTDR